MDESTYGSPHGRTSPLRWDPSTALALMLLGALAILFLTGLVHFGVHAEAGFHGSI